MSDTANDTTREFRGKLSLTSVTLAGALAIGIGSAVIGMNQGGGDDLTYDRGEGLAAMRVVAVQMAALSDHALGIHQGMQEAGIHVPPHVVKQVMKLEVQRLRQDIAEFSELRRQGVDDGVSGGWSGARLEQYISEILKFDSKIESDVNYANSIIDSRIDEAISSRSDRSAADAFRAEVKSIAVTQAIRTILARGSGEGVPGPDLLDTIPESHAGIRRVIEGMEASIRERFDWLERTSGLNPHEHAIAEIARKTLSDALKSEQGIGLASPH